MFHLGTTACALLHSPKRPLTPFLGGGCCRAGGDEVNTNCWTNTPSIAAWLAQHNFTADDGYKYFVQRAQVRRGSITAAGGGWRLRERERECVCVCVCAVTMLCVRPLPTNTGAMWWAGRRFGTTLALPWTSPPSSTSGEIFPLAWPSLSGPVAQHSFPAPLPPPRWGWLAGCPAPHLRKTRRRMATACCGRRMVSGTSTV